jgi:hypothetical protein
MAIQRLLESFSLQPEEIRRLVAAYEQTLRGLDIVDRNDPFSEMVAKKIIEIGKSGSDAAEIARLAISELAVR